MSRLAIIHERTPGGEWAPVGVVLGTRQRLDYRFLPDQSGWIGWAENAMVNSAPPYKDGTGLSPARGTWEDWVVWAVGAFSNGHDAWLTLVETPEPTVEANYEKYVLGAKPNLSPPPLRPAADEIPELGGFRKITTG